MQILLLKVSAHITEQLGMAPGGEFREAFKEVKTHTAHQVKQMDACFLSSCVYFSFFILDLFFSPRLDGCRSVNFTWATDRFL